MYATYMSVLGNREDLFGDSPYVDKYITNPPADYVVNPEYLNDEKFATLITEAEKYLGYPYVWGGSNVDKTRISVCARLSVCLGRLQSRHVL